MGSEDAKSTEPETYVKIISEDGYTFIIPERAALKSGFFKSTLSSTVGFQESETKVIQCAERATVLQTVVEYLVFKSEFEHVDKKDIPINFMTRIPPALALEILMAADFLDC